MPPLAASLTLPAALESNRLPEDQVLDRVRDVVAEYGVWSQSAAVRTVSAADMEDAAVLERLTKKAVRDPGILDTNSPYYWRAEVSSRRVDTYFTRMGTDSLQNFEQDAMLEGDTEGVSFMLAHNVRDNPIGHSLLARFIAGQGSGIARVEETFYTLRGLTIASKSTNEVIDAMRAGLLRDVSIGFYLGPDGQYKCNICGRDMLYDWDCWHIPGVKYAKKDPNTEKPTGEDVLAVADILGAHQAEASAVYDGACPAAAILKAWEVAQRGSGVTERQLAMIQQRYRIRLPGQRFVVGYTGPNGGGAPGTPGERGAPEPTTEGEPMLPKNQRSGGAAAAGAGDPATTTEADPAATEADPATTTGTEGDTAAEPGAGGTSGASGDEGSAERETQIRMATEADRAALGGRIRALLTEHGQAEAFHETPEGTVRNLLGVLSQYQAEAQDGRAYRVATTDAFITAYVRANGPQTAEQEAALRDGCKSMPITLVRKMVDDWTSVGDRVLGAGTGRQTTDQGGKPRATAAAATTAAPGTNGKPATPIAAFRGA